MSSPKEFQAKLRDMQLKRDNFNTFGHEYKDPCRKERDMSYECIENHRKNSSIDCTNHYNNFKKCKQFWNLVQEYRAVHLGAGRHDLPREEEYQKWKKQIPVWVETNKIVPPEDL